MSRGSKPGVKRGPYKVKEAVLTSKTHWDREYLPTLIRRAYGRFPKAGNVRLSAIYELYGRRARAWFDEWFEITHRGGRDKHGRPYQSSYKLRTEKLSDAWKYLHKIKNETGSERMEPTELITMDQLGLKPAQ